MSDLIREALGAYASALRSGESESERMRVLHAQALAALARMEAEIAAMRKQAEFWQMLHEEESWPYEWQVATALKDERDKLRADMAAKDALLDRVLDAGAETWHTVVNDEPSLSSWLGLTDAEYSAWVECRSIAAVSGGETGT